MKVRKLPWLFGLGLMAPSILFPLSLLANQYAAQFRQGDAPLPKKAKVTIQTQDKSFEFIPVQRGNGGSWLLSVDKLRGVQASTTGIWLYWFNDGGETQNAFFKVEQNVEGLVAELNKAISDYYGAYSEIDEQKRRYEEYRQRALQESQ